jgi:hypothetical protein
MERPNGANGGRLGGLFADSHQFFEWFLTEQYISIDVTVWLHHTIAERWKSQTKTRLYGR